MGYLLQARHVGTRPGLTDYDSGAYTPVATVFPACPRGWWWLGQRGYPGYGMPLPAQEVVVRPHPHADDGVVAPPSDWLCVWATPKGWAMWQAVAPDGYAVLGDVFHYDYPPNRDATFRSYACVRLDCVKPVPSGPQLWSCLGTGSPADASMWVAPDGTANPWQRFRVQPNYNAPAHPVYALDMDVVELVSG